MSDEGERGSVDVEPSGSCVAEREGEGRERGFEVVVEEEWDIFVDAIEFAIEFFLPFPVKNERNPPEGEAVSDPPVVAFARRADELIETVLLPCVGERAREVAARAFLRLFRTHFNSVASPTSASHLSER